MMTIKVGEDEKMKNVEERKRRFGFEWIKSQETGNSYLCPTGTFRNRQEVSDTALEQHCVNESNNPQNN